MKKIFEDKTSLIKKLVLPDIEDKNEKEEFKKILIDFFKKHSNYENKIDWNKVKTLTRKDFEPLLDLDNNTKSAYRKTQKNIKNIGNISEEIKAIFKSTSGESPRKFLYVGENDKWMFFGILNHNAARFCDLDVNQGGGAQWCIGENDGGKHWNWYINNLHSYFIMAFNKNFKSMTKEELQNDLKYMIQRDEEGDYHLWNQVDDDEGEALKIVKTNKNKLNKMFEKVIPLVDEEKEKFAKMANPKVEEILRECENEIKTYTIPKEYREYVTEINIPDNITKIGTKAFSNCVNLKTINIPNSVTRIEYGAFSNCTNLKSITIPNRIKKIKNYTFDSCEKLESVNIPDSVKEINDGAFSRCVKLESISIPNSVTKIGEWAFYQCFNLKSINIPDGVAKIGEGTFSYCKNLKSIDIPDNVTEIGTRVFAYCKNLKLINIPDGVAKIGYETFYSCENLESINIPNSVTEIGEDAFYKCINLKSITIPDSVTEIGDYTFSHCKNLESITIPDSVEKIGEWAFHECSPNLIITVSRNFDRNILNSAFIPRTTKFNMI